MCEHQRYPPVIDGLFSHGESRVCHRSDHSRFLTDKHSRKERGPSCLETRRYLRGDLDQYLRHEVRGDHVENPFDGRYRSFHNLHVAESVQFDVPLRGIDGEGIDIDTYNLSVAELRGCDSEDPCAGSDIEE